MKQGLCLAMLGVTAHCLACSGPNVHSLMFTNEALGWFGLGFLVVSSVPMVIWRFQAKGGPAHPLLLCALFAIHPVWHIGVQSGDCGFTLQMLTVLLMGLNFGLMGWQWNLRKIANRTKSEEA